MNTSTLHPRPWTLPLAAPDARDVLIRGSILVALAFVLPALTHFLPWGNMGPLLMPLAIPVFLGAFLLPLPWALAAAITLPLASWALTGMPPMLPPVAPMMILEGLATVAVVRALHRVTGDRLPLTLYILVGILANRVLAIAGLTLLFGMSFQASLAGAALGIAGLSLNLIAIPLLVRLFAGRGESSS